MHFNWTLIPAKEGLFLLKASTFICPTHWEQWVCREKRWLGCDGFGKGNYVIYQNHANFESKRRWGCHGAKEGRCPQARNALSPPGPSAALWGSHLSTGASLCLGHLQPMTEQGRASVASHFCPWGITESVCSELPWWTGPASDLHHALRLSGPGLLRPLPCHFPSWVSDLPYKMKAFPAHFCFLSFISTTFQ